MASYQEYLRCISYYSGKKTGRAQSRGCFVFFAGEESGVGQRSPTSHIDVSAERKGWGEAAGRERQRRKGRRED